MAYVDKDEIWNVFMNDEADILFSGFVSQHFHSQANARPPQTASYITAPYRSNSVVVYCVFQGYCCVVLQGIQWSHTNGNIGLLCPRGFNNMATFCTARNSFNL